MQNGEFRLDLPVTPIIGLVRRSNSQVPGSRLVYLLYMGTLVV